jgi:hypothetical protein
MSTAVATSNIGGIAWGATLGLYFLDVQASAPASGSPVGTQICQVVRKDKSVVLGRVTSVTRDTVDPHHTTFHVDTAAGSGTVDIWCTDPVKDIGDVAVALPGLSVARSQVIPFVLNGVPYGPSVSVTN